MLCPEEIAIIANAFSVAFAKNKSIPELSMSAAIFTQIGDTLATIATGRSNIEDCINNLKENCPTSKSVQRL